MVEGIFIAVGLSLLATYLTDPFTRFTIVRLPYQVKFDRLGAKVVDNNRKLRTHTNIFWRVYAWYQCGLYVLSTRYIHQIRSHALTETRVIRDIHKLRFDPAKLLLITGDHFNSLFVRNLGVFYYPTLDANIFTTEQDWQSRQATYLQTVAYALGVFAKNPHLKTTLVPMGHYSAVGINMYSYPSDALYGVLYALAALTGLARAGAELYNLSQRRVATASEARRLLEEYGETLRKLYAEYHTNVFNEATGLIKTSRHLSGAKDITKRRSAFYDNVIYWRTTELAMQLKLIPTDRPRLKRLKQRILRTFWRDNLGYFLEDLSADSPKNNYYSSDWLIILSTGFLNLRRQSERRYYERCYEYIQSIGVARPFAIKYQPATRATRQFLPVRLAVASYGGNSIWSFWGMEYVKMCLLLFRETHDVKYRREATYQIKQYHQNILKYGGFPEVYDATGKILQTPFYRSVLMTGWVIGYEQVCAMEKVIKTS